MDDPTTESEVMTTEAPEEDEPNTGVNFTKASLGGKRPTVPGVPDNAQGHGNTTNRRHVRCTAAVRSDWDTFFYSTPDSKLLTILLVITIVIVGMFLFIFKYVTRTCDFNDSSNASVGIWLGIVGVPVGVVLAFIVSTTWSAFSDAQAKENAEATNLLLLYNLLDALPGAEAIQEQIKVYTEFIIKVEFPLMEQGIQSIEGLNMITSIGDAIYELNPETSQETTLYSEAITMFESIMSLRIARLGYAVYGLAPELWWVLILGVIIVIFMSFFVYCRSFTLQVIMTCMSAAVLVSLLFLIVALNYPYRGDFGLDSLPFQIALANMVPDGEIDDTPNCPLRATTRVVRKHRRRKQQQRKQKLPVSITPTTNDEETQHDEVQHD